MLDPASIDRLAESPAENAPLLNLALAEEGRASVLLALARCASVGADALDVIADRVLRERDALTIGEDDHPTPAAKDLERELIGHPNAPRSVRDSVLARHLDDPFFVLTAAAHEDATELALEAGASWPGASPLHDRPWLDLLTAATRAPGLLLRWAAGDELLREAAALLSADRALLERLASDGSRRVRRAVASNPQAGELLLRLAGTDAAAEVRSRASRSPPLRVHHLRNSHFSALAEAMEQGGVLARDVREALLSAGPLLDEEGAIWGARYLDDPELCSLVSQATGHDEDAWSPRRTGVGVGLGFRSVYKTGAPGESVTLPHDIVHLVTRYPSSETRLTGKARVALWIAECLGKSQVIDSSSVARELSPDALASDRMVLSRWAREAGSSLARLGSIDTHRVAVAVIELLWRDPAVSDEAAISLAGRTITASRAERELPEDELDLAPLARPLAVLERAVLAAIAHAPVSPRAALAAIALDPRRCRYILAAMPTWKGALTGARLARVLRSHAGALSAASRAAGATASGVPPKAAVARWTERRLSETEAAIALAIGDLTSAELLCRLESNSIKLEEGVTMAAGIEARAALDGGLAFAPLLEFASARRTKDASALALWMLLEGLDRERAPSLIASAIDGLSISGAVVAPAVCEALATLERRAPGRLERVHTQSPRGRATVASAIARAYRSFGGTRDEG